MKRLFFLLAFTAFCLSLSIPWDDTKTVFTSNFELTTAKAFSTCDLAPDGSDLLDNCTAVFLVKNKWKSLSLSSASFNLQWLKTVSNAQLVYYKTYEIQDVADCNLKDEEKVCSTRKALELGDELPLSSLSSSVGDVTAIGVKFRKPRWTSTAFNVTIAGLTKLDPDIGVCGTLGTANTVYTMNTSLPSVTLTCFNVTEDNITLDCQGYTIYYGAFLNSFAVWVKGVNNFTLKNCNIYQNGSAGSHAVYLERVNNSFIVNNSNITTTGNTDYGIIGAYALNTSIDNNTLLVVSNASQRNIYLTGSNGTNVTNNVFWVNGSNSIGINFAYGLQYGANYLLAHNTFYSYNTSSRCIYTAVPYITVFNNSCYYYSTIRGIEITGNQGGWATSYSNISNNHVYANQSGASGIGIYYSHDTTIDSNDILVTGTTNYGLSLSNSSNITISNNYITANNTTGRAIGVLGNNSNINISNCTLNASRNSVTVGSIGADSSYSNNTNISIYGGIMACTTTCSAHAEIFLNQSSDLTIVNASWNRTNYTIGNWGQYGANNLTVKWFVQVNASDNATLAAISGALVNVTDNNSANVTYENTDATGLTQWRLFTDYIVTSVGGEAGTPSTNSTYYNALNFNVSSSTYYTNFTSLNVTSTQTVLILLYLAVDTNFGITLYSPNGTIHTIYGNFNCSANVSTAYLSLWTNITGAWAQDGNSSLNSTIFYKTAYNGTYLWNCKACYYGVCKYAPANYTILVDAPVVRSELMTSLPLFLTAIGLFLLGLWRRDITCTMLGSLLLLISSFNLASQGLNIVYDWNNIVPNTGFEYMGIGLTLTVTAMYFLIKTSLDYYKATRGE